MAGISMRELAELLEVSVASVSVALRGKPGISSETRARILEEARIRGYDMSRLNAASSKGVIEVLDYTYYSRSSGGNSILSAIFRCRHGNDQPPWLYALRLLSPYGARLLLPTFGKRQHHIRSRYQPAGTDRIPAKRNSLCYRRQFLFRIPGQYGFSRQLLRNSGWHRPPSFPWSYQNRLCPLVGRNTRTGTLPGLSVCHSGKRTGIRRTCGYHNGRPSSCRRKRLQRQL